MELSKDKVMEPFKDLLINALSVKLHDYEPLEKFNLIDQQQSNEQNTSASTIGQNLNNLGKYLKSNFSSTDNLSPQKHTAFHTAMNSHISKVKTANNLNRAANHLQNIGQSLNQAKDMNLMDSVY